MMLLKAGSREGYERTATCGRAARGSVLELVCCERTGTISTWLLVLPTATRVPSREIATAFCGSRRVEAVSAFNRLARREERMAHRVRVILSIRVGRRERLLRPHQLHPDHQKGSRNQPWTSCWSQKSSNSRFVRHLEETAVLVGANPELIRRRVDPSNDLLRLQDETGKPPYQPEL